MRILFLAPWFRTLSNIWARELRALGHEVLVVTSDEHFEPMPRRLGEVVIEHSPRTWGGVVEHRRLRASVRSFEPHVVVTEEIRDPRLPFLAPSGIPAVMMIHDAVPHDATHAVPWQRRVVRRVVDRQVVRVVVFSRAVARTLDPTPGHAPVDVIPLPSEMPDDEAPSLVAAGSRRDFFCIGRIRPYKNLAAVAEAWQLHVSSPDYRGDTLRIIGAGELGVDLPPQSEWIPGPFSFASVAPQLSAGKGSLAIYTAGSQSGAQIFSMQVGCAPIVSSVGGLGEYQLPALPPVDPTDICGVVGQLARLSDPDRAAALGAASRQAYRQRFSARVSAIRLAGVLESAVSGEPRHRS